MRLVEYPDAEMMAIDLASLLARELEEALHHRDTVLFAVPGGATPGPVFDDLCAVDMDWSRVCVVPTDERWVGEDDPRSNAGMIRRRLLTDRAAAATLLPLHAEGHRPEAVLADLETPIAPLLPISVLLLGMGADGHVASLFPGAGGLAAALGPDAPILAAMHPEGVPEPRVTLSARVLDGALSRHLVITGTEKRERLENAASLPPEQAPVAAILAGLTVHWAP